jgi:FkbM family methyltransferase
LSKLSRSVVARLARLFNRDGRHEVVQTVGSTSLVLPAGHGRIKYRSAWQLYDEPLTYIASAIRKVHGEYRAIDVGANVGDTAAAINAGGTVPVLCIEGDEQYWGYLERNGRAVGPHVVLEKSFVGGNPGYVSSEALDRNHGTTSAVRAIETGAANGVPVLRLEQILNRHPLFRDARLLKVDTDGFDFDIIVAHTGYLAARKPIVFFEYLIRTPDLDFEKSLHCIDRLLEIGYDQFLVFDNFGNYLLSVTSRDTFRDLNLFLLSNAAFGQAVYYLDVCAFAPSHADVLDVVKAKVVETVLHGARDRASKKATG